MVDETKCSSVEDGTTTDEDRDVRVDSGGSDEELCMDEEDEDDVSPTSAAAPGTLTFGISRLLGGGGGGGGGGVGGEASKRSMSNGMAAAAVSGPAEALASLYAAGHHAAVFGLHHHLHQQHQHMAAAAAAHQAANKPADDKASSYLQYSGAAGVIKVPAHRPHPSGGTPGQMPSPWAAAAMDPVSFMQRNAFLFAADKNRLAAGKFFQLFPLRVLTDVSSSQHVLIYSYDRLHCVNLTRFHYLPLNHRVPLYRLFKPLIFSLDRKIVL